MTSSRTKHSDHVYDLVAGRIQRGEVRQGERLVDVAIAADLGLSRMPVRDALMRLVHEGYLEQSTRGFLLPSLSPREVFEVFEIRRLLEPRAAAMAALAIGERQLRDMKAAIADAQETLENGDVPHFFRISERFRNGWLSAVPNLTLQQTIQRYLSQVQAVRLATMASRDTLKIIVAGQSDLLAALAQRDAVAASDHTLRFVIMGEIAYREATRSLDAGA